MNLGVKEAPQALKLQLLRDSFAPVSPRANELATRFYEILFERYPEVQQLFVNVRMEEQKKRLIRSIVGLIVDNLGDLEGLEVYLEDLGRMYEAHNHREASCAVVGECLLEAFKVTAPNAWNKEVEQAWEEGHSAISNWLIASASDCNKRHLTPNPFPLITKGE